MNVRDRIEILKEIEAVAALAGDAVLRGVTQQRIRELYSRPIPGFPGYRATIDGTILGVHGTVLSPWEKDYKRGTGYMKVAPFINGRRIRCLVHTLVALAFHGHPAEDHEIHHKNFKRGDNRPENLEYLTHAEHVALHHDKIAREYF
jgi:hypothetical protein